MGRKKAKALPDTISCRLLGEFEEGAELAGTDDVEKSASETVGPRLLGEFLEEAEDDAVPAKRASIKSAARSHKRKASGHAKLTPPAPAPSAAARKSTA